jgi:hypothetical protein
MRTHVVPKAYACGTGTLLDAMEAASDCLSCQKGVSQPQNQEIEAVPPLPLQQLWGFAHNCLLTAITANCN